jgi:hypothetical protein
MKLTQNDLGEFALVAIIVVVTIAMVVLLGGW